MKVGSTFFFFSHCTTRQVSFLAQAVLNCNLFWKIFPGKQDYRSMNKSHLFYQTKYIFWWMMHGFRCLLGTLYTLYNRLYIYSCSNSRTGWFVMSFSVLYSWNTFNELAASIEKSVKEIIMLQLFHVCLVNWKK